MPSNAVSIRVIIRNLEGCDSGSAGSEVPRPPDVQGPAPVFGPERDVTDGAVPRGTPLSEDLVQVGGETGQRRRSQRLPLAVDGGDVEAVGARCQDRHRFGVRVHEPILPDAVRGVQGALELPVPIGGGRRQDFDDEIRASPDGVAFARMLLRSRETKIRSGCTTSVGDSITSHGGQKTSPRPRWFTNVWTSDESRVFIL